MARFRAEAATRFALRDDARALHAWSVEQPAAFWPFLAEHVGMRFHAPPREIVSGEMPRTRWFDGATLNVAEHMLAGDGIAVIDVDDRQRERTLTRGELRTLVARCATLLDAHGIRAGDRVAAYLPNGIEALVVFLASAARGAIFTSCAPPMGVDAVVDRFAQVAPKILFATDGYWDAGRQRTFDLAALVARLPSVEHVLGSIEGAAGELAFAQLPFDHPLYILYTSGTTGLPKCLVHRAGGALLKHLGEQRLHCDIGAGDVVLYQTTTGWMMWNWLVSALACGATIVLHGGGLYHPTRDALWRLVERLGVTHFGTSATHLHACMRIGMKPRELGLAKLRCILSTGSPLAPEAYGWVYEHVKPDVHLASISGGTDIVGCFMLGDPTQPVHAGQIQGPALGVDLCAVDGELVCRNAIPSMPLALWGDTDHERYKATYFAHGAAWHHGDRIELTPEGGIIVWGRSDATLKPGGVRIGTGEIYRALEGITEVHEALAAGKRKGTETEIWLFVVLRDGATLDRTLRQRIANTILARTTPQHVPAQIFAVRDLPRTHSGKLVEIATSRVINDEPVDNLAAVANPSAFDEIRQVTR